MSELVMLLSIRGCEQSGEISCLFLLTGGRIGPRYVFQLLFSEKLQNG
jgi:hypothetical protein